MRPAARRAVVFAALLLGLGSIAAPARPDPVADLLGGSGPPGAGCDPIDPAACLLPFPNDFFTVSDPSTDTGRRVNLSILAMPRNVAGKPVDPTEWNRNDGFSPGSMALARVPGLDLHATWDSPLDNIADLSWYLREDAPIVLLDADTGQRHPFWSELDTNAGTTDAERLLIIRPAVNLVEGHRYIVGLRSMRQTDGSIIAADPGFAAYRDRKVGRSDPRRPHMEQIFDKLAEAGVGRNELYLAWDFTVASERNLSERALHLRDEAFAALGDSDLADGIPTGQPPDWQVTAVTERPDADTARRIEGTISVPNFMTPQVTTEVPDPVGEAVAVPLSRLNYVGSTDGLPARNPLQPTVYVDFVCNIPATAPGEPATPLIYGHGLLGSRTEANGGSTGDLRRRGFAPCAMDWWGMSFADVPTVALILADVSHFPSLADRSQQGFLNMLYLGRALAHPEGLSTDPAFQGTGGERLVGTGLVYDGNSQGGIMGGSLVALAPDLTRATLGVPGMNYSTLLNRSSDWEPDGDGSLPERLVDALGEQDPTDPDPTDLFAYSDALYTTYPSKIDQQLLFALVQMLWDRAEANGYAHHLTDDPLPGTPSHQVMLQVAFSDHQVANISAEVEARTMGARLHVPAVPDGLHWSADPTFGFTTWDPGSDGPLAGESVLVYWWSADRGLTTPPNGNVPPSVGEDPHEDPRRDEAGSDQVAHFLRTGEVVDVCAGGPCVTTDATR